MEDRSGGDETAGVHNTTLHATLEAFAADAAGQLSAETANGAEIPFEVVEEPGARASLYCYRPLTGAFIRERLGLLSALPTYAPAARALAALDGVDAYLRQRGEQRGSRASARERADAALRAFLPYVFAERSEFGFDPVRFEKAYAELERALYEGRCVATVIAPLLGIALEHSTQRAGARRRALADARRRDARRAGRGGVGQRRGGQRARGPDRDPRPLRALAGVDRPRALSADPDGAAAVRTRRLRARPDRRGRGPTPARGGRWRSAAAAGRGS